MMKVPHVELYRHTSLYLLASQVVLVVKNLPANAGDERDADLIPGLGRFPGEGNNTIPLLLPGKFHGQRRATFMGSQKSWT